MQTTLCKQSVSQRAALFCTSQTVSVWDTRRVTQGGHVNLIAKAHTEVEVVVLKICPTDDNR